MRMRHRPHDLALQVCPRLASFPALSAGRSNDERHASLISKTCVVTSAADDDELGARIVGRHLISALDGQRGSDDAGAKDR